MDTSVRPGPTELRVDVDRERAAELQVAPAEVVQVAHLALDGDTGLVFRQGIFDYPIRIAIDPAQMSQPTDLYKWLLIAAVFAQTLDEAGFNFTTIGGHLLSAEPGRFEGRPLPTYVGPFHEPFGLFSFLAAHRISPAGWGLSACPVYMPVSLTKPAAH